MVERRGKGKRKSEAKRHCGCLHSVACSVSVAIAVVCGFRALEILALVAFAFCECGCADLMCYILLLRCFASTWGSFSRQNGWISDGGVDGYIACVYCIASLDFLGPV